jgi:hypothetical protein
LKVLKIFHFAFFGCTNLTEIVINNLDTVIDPSAFKFKNIKKIYTPNGKEIEFIKNINPSIIFDSINVDFKYNYDNNNIDELH